MGCKKNMFKTICKECDLSTLKSAIVSQGLEEAIATLNPITVFGPTNKAFKKFQGCGELSLTDILLYHVVPEKLKSCNLKNDKKYSTLLVQGGVARKVRSNVYSCPTFNNVVTINGTVVVDADIKASNGVLHKIKKVLCPPSGTIVDIAVGNPDFSILVAALIKANLVDALNDPESALTVFAPTNQAFQNLLVKLGITLNQLLELPNLADILLYHVLGQTVFSPAIRQGKTRGIPTLSGQSLDLLRCYDKIRVRDNQGILADVISPDILAENGVIHVINKVLLP